jgi:hypothetical protein
MKLTTHFSIKKSVGILSYFLYLVLLFMIPLYSLLAQVMQSTNYQVLSDSMNVGGVSSSSTNYIINDTAGETGTGNSNSTNYFMHAGFWQMQESYIAITSPSDLNLSDIDGLLGGASEGVLSWQVTTDNLAGYTMNIKTATTPAMKSALDSFADYTPSGGDPDYNFSIVSSASAFGFSPEGTDTNTRFKDNGSACNIGSGETSAKCWDGFSTSPQTIAGKTSSNHPLGSAVNVRVRTESGSTHIQISGSYSASITVTALVL